ncbi:derlin-1-like [Argentina anserina]|uniref:derlin-1-like n=1 Tax=Argentina anserina TaxID=57926 RepID=UPI002176781C|nr:derlin-1-like [Potentilla anserina]
MSTLAEINLISSYKRRYFRTIPPVSKTILVTCLMTTSAYYLQLFDYQNISLDYGLVFKQYQVWRLFTNFIFLGRFSFPYAVEIFIIAKYSVSLEKGPFDKRTADYLWMLIFGSMSLLVMSIVPLCRLWFMGSSLVFMIVYVWSREFPNERINVYGVVSLKGFYLPYVMMALDLLLGNSLKPDMLGIVAGHLYYFLTVLHPLAGGKNMLKTPLWVHRIVAYWSEGTQVNAPVQSSPYTGVAFKGRSFRLNGNMRRTTTAPEQPQTNTVPQPNQGDGVAFRGRSHRLDRS